MKRFFIVSLCCALITGCGAPKTNDTTKNEDGTEMVTSFTTENEKFAIRLFKADDCLYYDTGKVSRNEFRCGTLDSGLEKTAEEFELPRNDGEANFECEGYQNVTGMTKEVPIGGNWQIFRKIYDEDKDLSEYTYCYRVKGQLHKAVRKSEFIVLAKEKELNFEDVAKSLFSSHSNDHRDIYVVPIFDDDKWGIRLSVENVTKGSATVKCTQFEGFPTGDLQTGSWYEIERFDGEKWQKVEYKVPEESVVWNSMAYVINKNDETRWDFQWEWLYGELEKGHYRIAKEIMDFRKAGDFTKDIYYAQFFVN